MACDGCHEPSEKVMWLCSVFAIFKLLEDHSPVKILLLAFKLCYNRHSLAVFTARRKSNDIYNWLKLRLTRPWLTQRWACDNCKFYLVRVRSPLSEQNKVVRAMIHGRNSHLRVNTPVRGMYLTESEHPLAIQFEPLLHHAYPSSTPLLLACIHPRCSIGYLWSTGYLSSPRPTSTYLRMSS